MYICILVIKSLYSSADILLFHTAINAFETRFVCDKCF